MSFGITALLLILGIVLLLFGTSKLRSMGSDLGSAIKGFKNALGSEDKSKLEADTKEGSAVEETKKVESSNK